MLLGFGSQNPLSAALLKEIMSSRKELSAEKAAYLPVLGAGGKQHSGPVVSRCQLPCSSLCIHQRYRKLCGIGHCGLAGVCDISVSQGLIRPHPNSEEPFKAPPDKFCSHFY